MLKEEFLWTEKYRPKTIKDCILPVGLKSMFQQFVDQKNMPNLLLAGGPGVGKTTVAKAMLDELDVDYMVINGSLNAGIDVLRNEISAFASSVSFHGGRKYVILDEADFLNQNSVQPALRNFMEEFSKNAGFILTCNYKTKIIEALHSRCSVIDFKIDNKEAPKMASLFLTRIGEILNTEKIVFDRAVVAEVIKHWFPDWRRILNELQRYSSGGKIDSGILAVFKDAELETIIPKLKEKDFTFIRKWVAMNSDVNATDFFDKLYKNLAPHLNEASLAQLVLILAKYSYQQAFVANTEINLAACLVEIMIEMNWKGN